MLTLPFGDGVGLDEPADDVVALALDREVAGEGQDVRGALWLVGQHDPTARVAIEIPEHHRLNDHGGAPFVGDVEFSPVEP